MSEIYIRRPGCDVHLSTENLARIKNSQPSPTSAAIVYLPLVGLEKEKFQSWYSQSTNEQASVQKKRSIQKYLDNHQLSVSFDKTEGSIFVQNKTIPARAVHKDIRDQNNDPNDLARWLVGTGYNPISRAIEEASQDFYFKLAQEGFEAGFLSRPEGDTDMANINEVVHRHPNCSEIFIVVSGKITLIDKITNIDHQGETRSVSGTDITLDMENQNIPDNDILAGGVRIHRNSDGIVVAMSYTVHHNSYHLLTKVDPGTEIILAKKVSSKQNDPNTSWSGRVVHPEEFTSN